MFSKLKFAVLLLSSLLIFSSCTRIIVNKLANGYGKHVGKSFPDLLLENVDGSLINTKTFKGKTVLLNTWGTWCGPCLGELPGFNAINKKLNDKPNFLLVNICARSDKAQWKRVVAEQNLQGINLYLPDSLFKKYDVVGFNQEGWPYPIILGSDGKILGGGIEIEPDGENLIAIYNVLKAMENIDATASTKKMISLSGKMRNIDKPEMKEFKDFFGKYADTTVKATATFKQ